jgi:hypothetical protein
MFKSPYETTAIPPYDVRGLFKDVETARAEDKLVSGIVPDAPAILAILNDADIPVIAHPITFTSVLDKKVYTVVDLRPYRAQVRRISDNHLELPNSGPIPFNLMRARLQQLWNIPNSPDLFNLSTFPQTVYSNWIANALGSRLSLDAETTVSLQALAAFWYQCQFEEGPQRTLSEGEAVLYAKAVDRATRIPQTRVIDLLLGYGKTITKASEFIEAAKTINSVRLGQATLGLLYTILATSWKGSTAIREVVGVAVEYPPTFLAMLWSAVHEKTYRDTPIAQWAQRYGREGNSAKFTANLGLLLKENEG